MAPLMSVILGSILVYFTHAEKHGVQVVISLKLVVGGWSGANRLLRHIVSQKVSIRVH